jgi:hypothetical protein
MSILRIKWNEDERKLLAEHVAKVRIKDITSSLTEILNEVQATVLPEGRRRPKLATYKIVPGFDRLVKSEIEKLVSHPPTIQIEKPDPKPEEILSSMTVGGLMDMFLDKVMSRLPNINGHTIEKVTSVTERYNVDTGITFSIV